MFKFHVVSLPHTKTTKEYNACAYTQKVLLFCKMMVSMGHEVIHYGAEGSLPRCDEHVDVISSQEQEEFFGGHDWHKKTFNIVWDYNLPYWKVFNSNAAREINKRKSQRDFLCLIGGVCQKPIADEVRDLITVEFGIGYYGVFSNFRVFESYSHMSAVYGMLSKDPDGRLYDAVIPNYYDPEDFPLGLHKEDYLLYLGRIIQRKGFQIALDTSRETGIRLVVAGQGIVREANGSYETEEGWKIPIESIEYVGYANVSKRAELMGKARALLAPTLFLEPFGGVAVEAQMCGTPAITTDHGGFTETVRHGVTGFRCRTLAQFVSAVKSAHLLNPRKIRRSTEANYSIHRVKHMYQEYFEMLYDLWGKGWPTLRPCNLGWLVRS